MVISTIAGDFDQARRDELKKAYDKAVAAKAEIFTHEEQTWLTEFAKHLLDYLANEGLK